MGKWIDYYDSYFGKLHVISHRIRKNNQTYYLCECQCGNQKEIRIDHLKNGEIQSCGCLQREKAQQIKRKDIANQQFGFLVAREPVGISDHRETIWYCDCLKCGGHKEVPIGSLTSGRTSSCGCIKKSLGEEKIESILKQYNIKYQSQYSFKDCLSNKNSLLFFDFAIFKENELLCLIEYQGIQHYEESIFKKYESLAERQERDNIKREYCNQKNIKLIEIPYWDYQKININYLKERIYNERIY